MPSQRTTSKEAGVSVNGARELLTRLSGCSRQDKRRALQQLVRELVLESGVEEVAVCDEHGDTIAYVVSPTWMDLVRETPEFVSALAAQVGSAEAAATTAEVLGRLPRRVRRASGLGRERAAPSSK